MSKSTETASLSAPRHLLVEDGNLTRRGESRLELPRAEVGTTDAQLVRRACDGERTAQEQLVRRYAPRLLAVCRARIGRHEAVEDLAQEALLRGLTHLESLEEPDKLGAWLRGIAVRVCLDWVRGRSRRQVPLSAANGESTADSMCQLADDSLPHPDQVDRREEHDCLLQAVDALPDELREPLLLFYYDEITYEQIATMLGISRATVNSRLARARGQLARRLAHLTR
jgi:RNA polymerase sigma-70 factor, ECF subfamily